MKPYIKVYGKIFMQVWILLLSTMIFIFGILLLTDLKNYKCYISSPFGGGFHLTAAYQEGKLMSATIICSNKISLEHKKSGSIIYQGGENGYCEFKSKWVRFKARLCIDVYKNKEGELTLVNTIDEGYYITNFVGKEAITAWNYEFVPRLHSVEITFPSWRYYVPIVIYILTLPLMGLSVYNITIIAIELAKQKKESETPVEETPLNL